MDFFCVIFMMYMITLLTFFGAFLNLASKVSFYLTLVPVLRLTNKPRDTENANWIVWLIKYV